MDAYLNFMTSVIEFWKNWIESTTRFGMSAVTAPLIPRPRVILRAPAQTGQQAGGAMELWDVGQAAPLVDMRNLRIFSPEFHLVLDPTIYSGSITERATPAAFRDTERQPGWVAERDGNMVA
jgi:hypothetical protein